MSYMTLSRRSASSTGFQTPNRAKEMEGRA